MTEPAFSPQALNPGRSRELAARVLGSVPVTQQAFAKLLGLLDIQESTDVATACVTLGGRSRLLLNPDFVATHCRTDAALSMLVMHELYHVLLGHTRLFRRITPIQNVAFDAIINAQLSLLFPDAGHTALFRNFYRTDELPWGLLRPPEGWPDRPFWALPGRAGRLHRRLYTRTSVTCAEMYALLQALPRSARLEEGVADGRLLGNHTSESDGEGDADTELTAAVRDIVARWPMHECVSGRDEGGELQAERIARAEARRQAVAVIRRALFGVMDIGSGAGAPRFFASAGETLAPYRSARDPRAELRALLGHEPFFYRALTSVHTVERRARVHFYLDVSGSMSGELPLCYAAVRPLLEYMRPVIHLYSTRIEDVSAAALRAGDCRSTGGTTIDCVTAHMVAHDVRRAVILTDGLVGCVPEEHRRRLAARGLRVNTVLTDGGDATFASAFRGRVLRLPVLY